MNRLQRPAASRGLTLLEMLVTLVLFGLISTLLWQALAQAARIEARLADQSLLAELETLQRAWLQQALAGVATGAEGEPLRFRGEPQSLEAWTTHAPWPLAGGLERMQLTLVRRQERGATLTEVVAQRHPAEGSPGDAPLWRWQGDGRLQYLDAQQQWQDRWPPAGAVPGDATQALPRAIRLVGPPSGPVWVAVVATQNPMVRRRDLAATGDDDR